LKPREERRRERRSSDKIHKSTYANLFCHYISNEHMVGEPEVRDLLPKCNGNSLYSFQLFWFLVIFFFCFFFLVICFLGFSLGGGGRGFVLAV
jgi:hypothetical protein